MIRLVLILTLFVMAAASGMAQRNNKIYYNIDHNDPYDLKKFRLLLDPIFIDWHFKKFPLGAGIQTNINPHYRINIELLFRAAYYDSKLKDAKDENLAENKLLPFMYMEGVFEVNAVDKLKYNSIRITLSKDYYLLYNVENYIKVPVQQRRIFAFRGGFIRFNNFVEGDGEFPLENGAATYQDDYYTMYTVNAPFVGFSSGTINKYRITVKNYGFVSRFRSKMFYADFMYGFKHISDIELAGGKEVPVDVEGFRPYGWRVGWQWIDNVTHMRFEVGQRPSISERYWYLMFGIGFQLIGNERA